MNILEKGSNNKDYELAPQFDFIVRKGHEEKLLLVSKIKTKCGFICLNHLIFIM